jgi:hypothetical protein
MTTSTLHPTPRMRDVFLEQVRVVALALRWAAAAVAMLAALALLLLVVELVTDAPGPIDFNPALSMLPGMAGLLLPIGIWLREERFGSGFLWTLPVDRRSHVLAKVCAGWVWLMVAVAIFVLWLIVLTLATGGAILAAPMVHVLPSPAFPLPDRIDASALRTLLWAPSPLYWFVPFTAATGAYVLASAYTVGVRHPLRWIIGVVLGVFLIVTAADVTNAPWMAGVLNRVVEPLYFGPYGADALLTARTESLKTEITLTSGQRVGVWRALPDLGHWAIATLLWTGTGVVALWAAACRHREQR